MYRGLFTGNVTSEITITHSKSGKKVVKFCIASTNDVKPKDPDAPRTDALFVHVEAWGALADLCEQYMRKGRKAAIYANRMRLEPYLSEKGEPRAKMVVTIDGVEWMDYRDGTDTMLPTVTPVQKAEAQNRRREAALKAMIPQTDLEDGFIPIGSENDPPSIGGENDPPY